MNEVCKFNEHVRLLAKPQTLKRLSKGKVTITAKHTLDRGFMSH